MIVEMGSNIGQSHPVMRNNGEGIPSRIFGFLIDIGMLLLDLQGGHELLMTVTLIRIVKSVNWLSGNVSCQYLHIIAKIRFALIFFFGSNWDFSNIIPIPESLGSSLTQD